MENDMARTRGALNKRTRAALSAAAEGRLEKGGERTINYLLAIANDPARDDSVRMQAANVALPYVKPKLATIEQRNIDDGDKLTEDQIVSTLSGLVASSPTVVDTVLKIIMQIDPSAIERAIGNDSRRVPPETGNVIPMESRH